MLLRNLRAADLPHVAALEQENPTPWSLSLLEKELQSTGALLLVVEEVGQVVGWLAASRVFPEAELQKIAVAEEKRRAGVGRKLLAALVRELVMADYAELFLEVRSKNRAALNFYQKSGFVQVGMRKGYYHAPTDDAVVMCLTPQKFVIKGESNENASQA